MKDNFSRQAALYAKYRPVYPAALFDFILLHVRERQLAWDCGTGNGQSAAVLSDYFESVYASDVSNKQLSQATRKENIHYAEEAAEQSGLLSNSVDLVTIAQAIHWFDFDRFYTEVRRVCKPGGLIAAWTYNLPEIDAVTDKIIRDYHFNTLAGYWDKERVYVDEGYASIPFPFKLIPSPAFQIKVNWDTAALEGYLHTWSALQKFIHTNGSNLVEAVMKAIRQQWKENETRDVIFPVHLKLGVVHE